MRGPAIALALALVACGSRERTAGPASGDDAAAARAVSADATPAATLPAIDWARRGLADQGCVVVRDLASGEERVSDEARCARPRRPYSTFKIANALIGVELGILDGPDAPMRWDPAKRPAQRWWRDEWKHDQTLRSAIAISAVPVFQDLALRIGHDRMEAALDRLGYGNRAIGDADLLDHFWLDGPLRISAREQVELVSKLAQGQLPVSAKAQEVVREVLLREERDGWKIFHKTGTGPMEDGDGTLAWLVGWIEHGAERRAFAMWIEAKDSDAARARREELAEGVWRDLGVPAK